MTHLISQIANFEQCNSGIPNGLIRAAAADYVADVWADGNALATAMEKGQVDFSEEVAAFNSELEDLDCETRASADDLEAGLKNWMEAR